MLISRSVWFLSFAWSLFPVFAHIWTPFPDLQAQPHSVFPGWISLDPVMTCLGLAIRHVSLLEILTSFQGFTDWVHPPWISLKGASCLYSASLSSLFSYYVPPPLFALTILNYLQFFESIKLVYTFVLWTYLSCYPLTTALLANSCLSFQMQLKHNLLHNPVMYIFVVWSVQHLFLFLCNAPNFLWGTNFPHCQWFPWRLILGFAVRSMRPKPGKLQLWISLIKRLIQGWIGMWTRSGPGILQELLGIPQQ